MDANLQAKKIELILWLSTLEDIAMIKKIIRLRESEKANWWTRLSEKERIAIEKGIQDADAGKLTNHSEVKKLYEKWL